MGDERGSSWRGDGPVGATADGAAMVEGGAARRSDRPTVTARPPDTLVPIGGRQASRGIDGSPWNGSSVGWYWRR
ncbi:MAG: hypothetical protein ACKOCW_13335 [Planctomycetaceae bacterium]